LDLSHLGPNEPQPFIELPAPLFNLPQKEIDVLKHYKPHHYPNKNGYTFATLLCTRDPSPDDIYLIATRALIYRFLWHPDSRSKDIPITVFVAPFIPQYKRDILAAEGAKVVELPLIEIAPKKTNLNSERWRDQYTKLNMWNQTDFTKIAYFDSDAFPAQNVDEIFDITQRQRCNEALLDQYDAPHVAELCDYVFAGVPMFMLPEVGVNGGLLIFEPNLKMHERLLRLAPQSDLYDNELMEQGLFEWVFAHNSPFPARQMDRQWNGLFPQPTEGDTLKVVHQKLWNKDYNEQGLQWMTEMWDESWEDMGTFYNSPKFLKARKLDGLDAAAAPKKKAKTVKKHKKKNRKTAADDY
jgi:inositol 3-alpha-galactosyltransferase